MSNWPMSGQRLMPCDLNTTSGTAHFVILSGGKHRLFVKR